MKWLVRIFLGIVAAVVLIGAVLALAVWLVFQPKDYQRLLSAAVHQSTGRELRFDGDFGLRLLPCCSVTLGRTTLGNPPGFPAGPFARVQKAALSLKLWPLLVRREVEIGAITLDGLDATLIRHADGSANWQFSSATGGPDANGPTARASRSVRIAGITIRDGRVAYRNEQTGGHYLAEHIDLRASEVSAGKLFDLRANLQLTRVGDGMSATLKLASGGTLDADGQQLTLTVPQVEIAATGAGLPGRRLSAKVAARDLTVNLRESTALGLHDFQGEFELPGLKSLRASAAGTFVVDELHATLGENTRLSTPALAGQLSLDGPGIPGNNLDMKFSTGAVSLDPERMTGTLTALDTHIEGLGASMAISGSGELAEDGVRMGGRLKLEPVSPRSLLAVLQKPVPQTADPQALTRLAGTAEWRLQPKTLTLENLAFQLDQTKVNGTLRVSDFARPATTFDLRLDNLDLDRYRAPAARAAAGAEKSAAAPSKLPLDTLKALRLQGAVQIGQLNIARARLAGVIATIQAANGKLRIDPLSAQLYGGNATGSLAVDTTGDTAQVSVNQQLTAVRIGNALRDRYKTSKLDGLLSAKLAAAGTGRTDEELLKSLAGSVSMSLADGAYQGVDLWYEIRNARARLKGIQPPTKPDKPQTRITAMELAGNIAEGVVHSDKLLAQIPFIRLTGQGGMNLVDKSLDYGLKAQVVQTPEFSDGTNLKDLTGLSIPLTVKGAMDAPRVGVDLQSLAATLVTDKARQKLKDKLLKSLGADEQPPAGQQQPESSKDALKRSLRDLLGK